MNKFLEQYWWKTAKTDDVKSELNAGVDVLAWGKGENGLTALHWAALYGKSDCMRLLLQAGANAKVWSRERGTPLHLAAQSGNAQCVQVLLNAGADVNEVIQSYYGNRQTALDFVVGYDCLAGSGDAECFNVLLNAGAAVNIQNHSGGQTPLFAAAWHGTPTMIERLVSAGADVNFRDKNSQTPLLWAAVQEKSANIQALISTGANVLARDNSNRTALHLAALSGVSNNIKVLLEAGADVNAQTEDGRTPLMLANAAGTPIDALIGAGAEVNIR